MTKNVVFVGGESYVDEAIHLYEKTSSTYEEVAGRIGSPGTAAHQVKLFVSKSIPVFIFDKQTGFPGIVSAVSNSAYATDAKPVNGRSWGCFKFYACLNDGNVAVRGGLLQPEGGTGKLDNHDGAEPLCAIALEAVTASGADADILALSVIGSSGGGYWVEEYITISSDTGAVTYTPVDSWDYIESVYAATTTGGLAIGTAGAPLTGCVKVSRSTGVITCKNTDGVTYARVRYKVYPRSA